MHVGDGKLRVTTRTDVADYVALFDGGAPPNASRTEMRQSHGKAVGGLDRHGLPTDRNRPGERDGPCRGRRDGRTGRCSDVDPAVLSRGVRVLAELEPLQNRPFDRPSPGAGVGRQDERAERACDEQPH
jgi:hypothetical protein